MTVSQMTGYWYCLKEKTAPIASNLREEGRAKNRRVEVFLK